MNVSKFVMPALLAVTILVASEAIAEGSLYGGVGSAAAYGKLGEPALTIPVEMSTPGDPYVSKQWPLHQIRVLDWQQFTSVDQKVLVAILDTGIDENHEDLRGRVIARVNFTDSPMPNDIQGHGTHIAGIIAANSNNGLGIVGVVPDSRLMNIKVADDTGRIQSAAVARGIIWAVDNGASVINISVEFEEPSSVLEDAVNYAWSRGAVIVAAAGNGGNQLPVYPAYYENCIAVAAAGQDGTLAPLSNYGDWVDVTAPGFSIYSTLPGNSYGYKSGTSFAAAYVSGLAALLFGMATDTDGDGRLNDEVRAAIEAGCKEFATTGMAARRIDATNSVAVIIR
jgi:thermitase